jgi:hypothetical protein
MMALVVKVYPQIHPASQGDGFELGWSFFVAAGTLGLAGMTGWLAWKTRSVASETRKLARETKELARRTAEDVAAQFRPVLVPDADSSATDRSIDYNGNFLTLWVRNSGRGPALGITATAVRTGRTSSEWNQGALPSDLTAEILFSEFPFPASGEESEVALTYDDLAGKAYRTVVAIHGSGQADGGVYFHIRDVKVERLTRAPQDRSAHSLAS